MTAAVYIFNECCGPKNTDHTVSYITDYVRDSGVVPTWIRQLHIFIMLALPIKTNSCWVGQLSQCNKEYSTWFVCHSSLLDTRNLPLIFNSRAQPGHLQEVMFYNTQELGEIAEQYAHGVIDDGEKVRSWRDSLDNYSALPGIRDLHDFVRSPVCDTRMKVHRLCYTGNLENSTFHVKRGYSLNWR